MRKVFALFLPFVFFISCFSKKQKENYFEYKGFGAGTTFMIEYDKNAGNLNAEIDVILKKISSSVDVSNSASLINAINRNDSTNIIDSHFKKLLELSAIVYKQTNKAFDPTAALLDRYWNGEDAKYLGQAKIDSSVIDSLKQFVGFENIFLSESNALIKKHKSTIIDFKNIYKGYTVDLIADLFGSYHVQNYRIEIGGRIKAKGNDPHGKKWNIGVDEPTDDPKKRKLLALATLDGDACVTAGTYREFWLQNGMKLPYTIDPQTGYPVKHTLISVTVFTTSCADADAYSAAFMVMGPEATKSFLNTHPQLQVYMISTNYKGEWMSFISDGLKEKLEIIKEDSPI